MSHGTAGHARAPLPETYETEAAASSRGVMRTAILVWVAATLLVAAAVGIAARHLWEVRWAALQDRLSDDTALAESHIEHVLSNVDLWIQRIDDASPSGDGGVLVRESVLHAVQREPTLRSVSRIGADGRIVASTNPALVGQEADERPRSWMPDSAAPVDRLRLGRAWRGRDIDALQPWPSDDAPGAPPDIILARRDVPQPDGTWRTYLIALNVGAIFRQLEPLVTEPSATLTVWRYDGVRLLQLPAESDAPRTDWDALAERGGVAVFERTDPDGMLRLTAYRSTTPLPYAVTVDIDPQRALAAPRRQIMVSVAAALGGWLLLSGVALAWYRLNRTTAIERERMAQQLRLVATVFDSAQEAIAITDLSGRFLRVNAAFERITGYPEAEVLGKTPRLLSSGRHTPAFYAQMWATLRSTGHWEGEIWNRRRNGEVYAELLRISTVRDAQGNPQHFVAIFSDITSQKHYQTQLERIAHYDTLTGLPNRTLLRDRLELALAQAARQHNTVAVAFIDLDGFKAVNDQWGHAAGDALLATVAQRLRDALRESDTVARLGGDEFVAVLGDLRDVGQALPVLERCLERLREPYLLAEGVASLSASIGVAVFPRDGETADTLLRHADQAMYTAKQAGKNNLQFFDAENDRLTRERAEARAEFALALQRNELELYFQPKVNLRTRRIVGAEALIRWHHPDKGLLMPGQFLPNIEGHAVCQQLGGWVLRRALEQMRSWRALGHDIPLSVNIAVEHLEAPGFVDELSALLQAFADLPPQALQIEILESGAMLDPGRIGPLVEAIQAMGVPVAIDDFGTGYASLAYLKHLPARVIKIDQGFVREMLAKRDDRAIVQAIIALAHAFEREVVAEGVETAAHVDALVAMGCEVGQGYGIARPMPAASLLAWLQAHPVGAA